MLKTEVVFFSQSELSLVYHQLSRASCYIASLAAAVCIHVQEQQLGSEPGDIHEYAQAVTIGWCGCAGLRQHAERRASALCAVPARSGAALPVHAQRGVRHAVGSCGSAERGCV